MSSWIQKPIDLYGVVPVVIGSSIWYNGNDGIGEYNTKINNIVKTHKHEDIFSSFNMITPNHSSPSCSIGDKLYVFNGDTGDLIIFNTTSKKVEAVKDTEVLGHNASIIAFDNKVVIVGDGFQSEEGASKIIYNSITEKLKTIKDDYRFNKVNEQIFIKYKDSLYRFAGMKDGDANHKFYACTNCTQKEEEWEWTEKEKWSFPSEYVPEAYVVYNNYVITLGGEGDDGFSNSIYSLDLDNDKSQWKKLEMTVPKDCEFTGAVLINGNVHIFGKDEEWTPRHYSMPAKDILSATTGDDDSKDDTEEQKCSEADEFKATINKINLENENLKKLVETLTRERDMALAKCKEMEIKLKAAENEINELRPREIIDYMGWNVDQVVDWICALDDGQYREKYEEQLRKEFKEQGISGAKLKELDKNDLRGYGVGSIMDRNAIYRHIEDLINNN